MNNHFKPKPSISSKKLIKPKRIFLYMYSRSYRDTDEYCMAQSLVHRLRRCALHELSLHKFAHGTFRHHHTWRHIIAMESMMTTLHQLRKKKSDNYKKHMTSKCHLMWHPNNLICKPLSCCTTPSAYQIWFVFWLGVHKIKWPHFNSRSRNILYHPLTSQFPSLPNKTPPPPRLSFK